MKRTNDLVDRILRITRTCLRCGKKFSAEGPYNRLCFRCVEKNHEVTPLPTFGYGQHHIGGVNHD